MITLVDLEISNVNPVVLAFRRVGAAVTLASEANALEDAQAGVLPDVGSFPENMARLHRRDLVETIRDPRVWHREDGQWIKDDIR